MVSISIIIPAHNEEKYLGPLLRRLRRTALERIEIIVVDGASFDQTAAVARPLSDRVIVCSRAGRARQMHEGAKAAQGALLVFLHADTFLPDDWYRALQEAWSRVPAPIATAFRVGFDSPRFFYRCITRTADFRTWLTRVPHGDQAIALTREIYFRAGGFPDMPLMEEYGLYEKLLPLGRTVILPQRTRTSVRRYEQTGRIFNNLRNVLLVLLYYLGVSAQRLARLYR